MIVVYDASSKVFGPSLNDCLHVGPSLNPLLLDILLRFRVHEVAVTAGIEKAFLNIERLILRLIQNTETFYDFYE